MLFIGVFTYTATVAIKSCINIREKIFEKDKSVKILTNLAVFYSKMKSTLITLEQIAKTGKFCQKAISIWEKVYV